MHELLMLLMLLMNCGDLFVRRNHVGHGQRRRRRKRVAILILIMMRRRGDTRRGGQLRWRWRWRREATDPGLERSPLGASVARSDHGVEAEPLAGVQHRRQIAVRLELTALYVEEHLLVVVHVDDAVLGKDAQNEAMTGQHAATGSVNRQEIVLCCYSRRVAVDVDRR